MKVSAYPAFAATAFQARLAYRNQVWAGVFGELVATFAYIAVWTTAFAGSSTSTVAGVTLPEMITYVLLAGSLLHWRTDRLINELGESVRTGDVTVFLLKPFHYPGFLAANHFGQYAFDQIVITLPVAIIVALTVGLLPPASLFHGVMFVPFAVVSWLILFCLACLAGLLAFWLMTVFALEWFLRGIMALCSGAIVPLWFMPTPLATALGYLPFAWVSYYPSAVYLGKLDPSQIWSFLGLGCAWLLVLGGFLAWLWARARRRLVVQGG
jgi:ABC-2 type transport system permease protein